MTAADLLRLFIGALIGSFGTLFVGQFKSDRDEMGARCKEFADACINIANFGADYWHTEPSTVEESKLRAKLIGGQSYLDLYASLVCCSLSTVDAEKINNELVDLYFSLTGGTFGEPGRPISLEMACKCQVAGATVAVSVRSAHQRSVSLKARFFRLTSQTATGFKSALVEHRRLDAKRRVWSKTGNWPL